MNWDFNGVMSGLRKMTGAIKGLEEYADLFPDWEVHKACETFDTTGNVAPGNMLVMMAGSNGGPVYVAGDEETTEHLLNRLIALRSSSPRICSQLLSITYAIHLHCL